MPSFVDTYRLRFRNYYEPFTNQSNAFFMFVVNELGAGEYYVPQCAAGTPPDRCEHAITGHFRVRDSMLPCQNVRSNVWCAPGWNESQTSKVALLRAGSHCHAPACLNETLYNADTGEVLCMNKPLYGNGTAVFQEAG